MNAIRHLPYILLLCTACSTVAPASSAAPDERDRQVLETLLLHLLSDSKFDMILAPSPGSMIVLDAHTPEKTGFLQHHQISAEIGGRDFPSDAESDMRRRNTPADALPDTYDSTAASFTNLKFSAGIVVTDLTKISHMGGPFMGFIKAYPQARGWLQAYLPGYSPDGTRAVIRASIGPSAHGAMLTAVLAKRGDAWTVVWCDIAYFA